MPFPPTTHRPRQQTAVPRARWVAWVALVSAVVCVSAMAGCVAEPGSDQHPSSPAPSTGSSANAAAPRSSSSGADPVSAQALEALLTRREGALAEQDRARYAATVADPQSSDGRAQLRAFDTAVTLGVRGLAHQREFTDTTTEGSRALTVVLRYRVGDVDTADRTASVEYHLSSTQGEWRVASERPSGPGSTAPWLALAGASVRHTEHAVVAGTVAPIRLSEYADLVERARTDLTRSWALPDRVLVLAPATRAETDALLGRPAGDAAVAATTEGPVRADGTATGDRVTVDPEAFARLTPAGRQVVVAHELTHVAVRASIPGRSQAWVSEGYADHIGYGYARLPVARLAGPLVLAVRAGRAPTRLPEALDVDPSRGDIEVAYLASWQAVQLLIDEHGEQAVRRFVRAASSTGTEQDVRVATDQALRDVLGTTREDLTRAWQARLRSLAG